MSVLNMDPGAEYSFGKHRNMPGARAPLSSFLAFIDNGDERKYLEDKATHVLEHDKQAAAVYLSMVAFGSLLYLIISAFIPAAKANRVDSCTSLIICSWIGPAVHLAVAYLIPKTVYLRHRTAIVLALRVFYLLATSINGFGVCGVGKLSAEPAAAAPIPAAVLAVDQLESPFSAFLWRSGIIGLVWYSGAFPLLFRHHILVQTVFLAVYSTTLSPLICSDLARVQWGPQVIAAVRAAANLVWSQILASLGAVESATQHLESAQAAAAAAGDVLSFLDLAGNNSSKMAGNGDLAGNSSGSNLEPYTYRSCLQGLSFLQFTVGFALPTIVLYCLEFRSRVHWWLAQQRQQQRRGSSSSSDAWQRAYSGLRHSDSSSSSSGSSSLGLPPSNSSSSLRSGSSPALAPSGKQEPAAASAANAAAAGAGPSGTPAHKLSRLFHRKGKQAVAAAAAATGHSPSAAASAAEQPAAVNDGSRRRRDSSSSGGDSPIMSAFDVDCVTDSVPLTSKEVYLFFVGLGLTWIALEYVI